MSDSNEGGGGMNWIGIIIGAIAGLFLGKGLLGGLIGAVAGQVGPSLIGGLLGGGDNSQGQGGGGILGMIGGFIKKLFGGGKSQDQAPQAPASTSGPQAQPSGYNFDITPPPATPPVAKDKGQGGGYQF